MGPQAASDRSHRLLELRRHLLLTGFCLSNYFNHVFATVPIEVMASGSKSYRAGRVRRNARLG